MIYLGVPLISSRLRYEDYGILKERIHQRIMSWSNVLLTFGGRAQLIDSVLFNIQVYWCSLFIPPQQILKEIESMLRAFLWTGVELKSSSAKVKWADVCTPKKEGGLGFKPLKEWNKATMLRHLWAISKKADNLWVRWIHAYVIKHRNLWYMDPPNDSSWTIRKLFKLRSLGQPLIKHRIGNGNNTFVWLDNWHPLGPLYLRSVW